MWCIPTARNHLVCVKFRCVLRMHFAVPMFTHLLNWRCNCKAQRDRWMSAAAETLGTASRPSKTTRCTASTAPMAPCQRPARPSGRSPVPTARRTPGVKASLEFRVGAGRDDRKGDLRMEARNGCLICALPVPLLPCKQLECQSVTSLPVDTRHPHRSTTAKHTSSN